MKNTRAALRLIAFKKGRGVKPHHVAYMSVADSKKQHPDGMNFTDCGFFVNDARQLDSTLSEVLQQPLCTTLYETTTPPPSVATIEP